MDARVDADVSWLPFVIVPRSVYEQMVATQAKMTDAVINMKLAGGIVVKPPGARPAKEPSEFEKAVESAIRANKHASTRPGIAARLRAFAFEQLDAGKAPADILERLHTWSSPHREDPDEKPEPDDVIKIVIEEKPAQRKRA